MPLSPAGQCIERIAKEIAHESGVPFGDVVRVLFVNNRQPDPKLDRVRDTFNARILRAAAEAVHVFEDELSGVGPMIGACDPDLVKLIIDIAKTSGPNAREWLKTIRAAEAPPWRSHELATWLSKTLAELARALYVIPA